MNESVSVIIPVYKVEAWLDRCITSVQNQTYQQLEIILVDDGSPDRCGVICDAHARNDQRISVIHKQNGGLSDARNAGIEKATGQYLVFLDSDDWVHPSFIARLHALLHAAQADLAICHYLQVSDERQAHLPEDAHYSIYELNSHEALRELAFDRYMPFVVAWGKLYKKELFDQVRFPVGKIHEDEYVAHQLIYKARKVVYTEEPLLYYWQRSDSITGKDFDVTYRLHVGDAFMNRAAFYAAIGMPECRDKVYRDAFMIYRDVFSRGKTGLPDRQSLYRVLKTRLREGHYSIRFKLYYELFFICPPMIGLFDRFYQGWKHRRGQQKMAGNH